MQTLEELPFVAGNAALDFVNTAEERGHPEAGDVLEGPDELLVWGRRYGLLSDVAAGGRAGTQAGSAAEAAAHAEFARAIALRELLYGLLLERASGVSLPAAGLGELTAFAVEAYAAGALAETADGTLSWRWPASELSTIRHVAATSAVALLESGPTDRLKQCPGDHCGWFFLDATKRGNRRWCSMSECGQDAKDARRRAARSREEPQPRSHL